MSERKTAFEEHLRSVTQTQFLTQQPQDRKEDNVCGSLKRVERSTSSLMKRRLALIYSYLTKYHLACATQLAMDILDDSAFVIEQLPKTKDSSRHKSEGREPLKNQGRRRWRGRSVEQHKRESWSHRSHRVHFEMKLVDSCSFCCGWVVPKTLRLMRLRRFPQHTRGVFRREDRLHRPMSR
jgi:hypothetical protein